MLQIIRERTQGWILGAIVILISIPFAFFGINTYMGGGGTVVVAEINGTELELQRFQRKYQDFRRRFVGQFGEQIDVTDINDEELKNEALKLMVSEEVLRQAARDAGLHISDRQVAAAIHAFEAFRVEDEFDQSRYEMFLSRNGLAPIDFESQLHDDMLSDQFRQGVAESVFTTEEEVNQFLRVVGQRRDFRYLVFSAVPYIDSAVVTDEQVLTRYEQNSDSHMTPEIMKVEYVVLALQDLMAEVEADEEQLRKYYQENKRDYSIVEERSANHILVELDSDEDEAGVDRARQEALSYRDRALAGEPFEDIAREVSDDIGSREDGGQTGFFRKGTMAPEFDDMVFSMAMGEISVPVRTEFGFHIIKLREVKAGGVQTFEQAREKLEEDFQRAVATSVYTDRADKMAALSYEYDETLEIVATDLNLPVEKSDWFDRQSGAGLFTEPKLRAAAFDPRVLVDQLNSKAIEITDNRLVVLRALEHKEAERKRLEEVYDGIAEELVQETAEAAAEKAGQAALQRLTDGESADALAQSLDMTWLPAQGVDRGDLDVNRAILMTAFKLPHPLEGKTVRAGVPLANGDYGVIELSGVRYADPDATSETERKQIGSQLRELKGRNAWDEYVIGLEETADIETYPGNL